MTDDLDEKHKLRVADWIKKGYNDKWYEKYITDEEYNVIAYRAFNPSMNVYIVWETMNGRRKVLHREYAPAEISWSGKHRWCLNGNEITEEVKEWIKENNYPQWEDQNSWDDDIKLHFKMRFL